MYIYMYIHAHQRFPKHTKSCSHFPKILPTSTDLKAGYITVTNGKNWLLSPETSSQSEKHSNIHVWLIWLLCREPLHII